MKTEISDLQKKLDGIDAFLATYQVEAADDVKINKADFEQNFNRSWLILKWLDRSLVWRKKLDTARDLLNKAVATASTTIVENAMYNITDKQLKSKVDADDVVRACTKQFQSVDIIHAYCVRMQEILKGQTFEVRDHFAYLRFKNGVDH